MALEEHVSALQQQLEQSELDCVHKKAQIATLARLADAAPAAVRPPPQDPATELADPRSPAAASQPRSDALRISGLTFSQVCGSLSPARQGLVLLVHRSVGLAKLVLA